MSTCQDICLISVWGLEDWNPYYGHHQLFPSSLQVWRDSFEMKNIKADLTELSDGALIPLTWLNPQLPSVWIQSPTQTCYWCSFRGLSTHPPSPWETARGSIVCDLWVGLMGTRSWAKWSRALPCPDLLQLCAQLLIWPAQHKGTSDKGWKEIENWSESFRPLRVCLCFGEELKDSSICTLTLGHRGGGLSFYYSSAQKLVTIETLCIGCYINARQTDLLTEFLPFSSGWHKGREQTGREMDGSDVRSQSCAYPKRMHDLILQTACL